MQNVQRDYVIVPDADLLKAGAQIHWRLKGETDRVKLDEELKTRGLGNRLPAVVEPETAIRRAVGRLRGKRRLIRPLGRRGSWAVVEEELDVTNEKLKHWDGPTISLDKIGRAVFKNATADEARLVTEAYEHCLDVLDTTDVSGWLIQQADRLRAAPLRAGGGIYYLPPQVLPEWLSLTEALAAAHPGHTVYVTPTIRMTPGGARAIIDGLVEDTLAQVEKIQGEVIDGDLGVRALEHRADVSRQLLTKVSQYEELLATPLETLRSALGKLGEDVAAAKLAAEALKDEQS